MCVIHSHHCITHPIRYVCILPISKSAFTTFHSANKKNEFFAKGYTVGLVIHGIDEKKKGEVYLFSSIVIFFSNGFCAKQTKTTWLKTTHSKCCLNNTANEHWMYFYIIFISGNCLQGFSMEQKKHAKETISKPRNSFNKCGWRLLPKSI